MTSCARIAITAGEPAGIGPELCVQLAQQAHAAALVVIADPDLLQQSAITLRLPLTLIPVDFDTVATPAPQGALYYLPCPLAEAVQAGKLNVNNAAYVLESLTLAMTGCLSGQFDAMVTAPVHKGIINDAGFDFTGHTEFLAAGAAVEKVVMMLATPDLRVALVTTHLPLKDVSTAITKTAVNRTIEILHTALQQQFGILQPRIAVCGLNPHAGEGGHMGREEIEVITPVLEACQQRGIGVSGPWPADTIFVASRLADYDAVLAMYHDQGLPVLKHHGFGAAVNITLGLPFIRTSVDHGTALDLAGTGTADVGSLQAAVMQAGEMIVAHQQSIRIANGI